MSQSLLLNEFLDMPDTRRRIVCVQGERGDLRSLQVQLQAGHIIASVHSRERSLTVEDVGMAHKASPKGRLVHDGARAK